MPPDVLRRVEHYIPRDVIINAAKLAGWVMLSATAVVIARVLADKEQETGTGGWRELELPVPNTQNEEPT